MMGEREVPWDLLDSLLEYIKSLNMPGAVPVFLPDWAHIFSEGVRNWEVIIRQTHIKLFSILL